MIDEVTQFCIGLENKTGTFAGLCGLLTRADVNVRALFVSEEGKYSWVNLVADPAPRAEQALIDGGYKFFTEKVLTLQVGNQPGELERLASRLAEADVNISYLYGSGVEGASFALVLNLSDLHAAAKALKA